MSIKKMKKTRFPSVDITDWEKAIKEPNFFFINSNEHIKRYPLYTKQCIEHIQLEQLPGEATNRRGYDWEKPGNDWAIAQRIQANDFNQLKSRLKEAITAGQESISLLVDEIEQIDQMQELIEAYHLPIVIMTKRYHRKMTEQLKNIPSSISGIFGNDLLSAQLSEGYIYSNNDKEWHIWEENIKKLNVHKQLKTILIDTTPYHTGGANIVQELAIAIAEAIYFIEFLKAKNWALQDIIDKMAFHFAIGADFFMEVAKIRAFRILMSTIVSAYQVEHHHVVISAETSEFTKTILDPYVNIIRSGNEAMAAILGGVDYLHITPFDAIQTDYSNLSDRLARNTHHILREESHFDKVRDPVGGSYYVESLTEQLVDKAWTFFLKIDQKGGMLKVLETGWLQSLITNTLQERLEAVKTGKQSIIGVNAFRDNNEDVPVMKHPKKININKGKKVRPLIKTRLVEQLELTLKKGGNCNEET